MCWPTFTPQGWTCIPCAQGTACLYEGCSCKEITSGICCVVNLALWFVLFFTLLYPQVLVNNDYKAASCTILNTYKEPYSCCYQACETFCASCDPSAQTCGAMLSSNLAGACCNGPKCCRTCCDTCQTCTTDSAGTRTCSSTSCNCTCCDNTANEQCNIVCPTCWRAHVEFSYTCAAESVCCGSPVSTQLVQDCGEEEECADQFLEQANFLPNSTSTCWFNPFQCTEVDFARGYTWWYWLVWSFPTVIIVFLLNLWTFIGFNSYYNSFHRALILYLVVWWIVLFPLVFLLPLALASPADQVPQTAKNGILVFALVLASCGVVGALFSYWLYRRVAVVVVAPMVPVGTYVNL